MHSHGRRQASGLLWVLAGVAIFSCPVVPSIGLLFTAGHLIASEQRGRKGERERGTEKRKRQDKVEERERKRA